MSDGREIIAVRYGTRKAARSEIYFNYERYGEPDSEAVMDYFFWIIRDQDDVTVVDTGFSAASGARRRRDTTITPADALARLGIDPLTVKKVILTHAHYDHTGNLGLFPKAQILMSRTEHEFIAGPFADRPHLAVAMDAEDNAKILRLAAEGRVTLVGQRDVSLPGIELIELPGHSPGQMAVMVERPDGPILLSSDVVHYYEELERDRPFAVMSSLLDMYRSFAAIRERLETSGAVLVPGHDPEVMRRFPLIDREDRGFAVRIG